MISRAGLGALAGRFVVLGVAAAIAAPAAAVEDPSDGGAVTIVGEAEPGDSDGETAVREEGRESVDTPAADPFAGQEPAEVFVEGNRRYEAGEYDRAIEAYRSLVDRGLVRAEILYNLGNALLRDGRLGAAIAAYRRAQVLAPRDRDLDANLRFARASTRDAIEPPAPGVVRRTLFFWHYALSTTETVRLAIVANLVLFAALSLLLVRRGSEPLRWTAMAAAIVLTAAAGSLLARWMLPLRVAVVLPAEIEAHSGTDAGTVTRFRLHAGSEVRAVEVTDEWVRIALPDGEQGWVGRHQVEVVRAPR